MNYRETFILRAMELLKSYKGHLPPDIRNIVQSLSGDRQPGTLTSEEFNALQEVAERIETAQRLSKVQRSGRRAVVETSASLLIDASAEKPLKRSKKPKKAKKA